MDNNKAEQERKELNKKLLKKTFMSEIKIRRKEKFTNIIIYFISFFIAFNLTDWIVKSLQIDLWFIDMAISVVLAMIMLLIVETLFEKLKFVKKDNFESVD